MIKLTEAKELIAWRETHGLGQAELARLLSVTPVTVWRWEAEKTKMPDWLRFALPQIEAELREERDDGKTANIN